MKITTATEIMRLATRRQGVKPSEISALLGSRASDVAKTMRSLEERGYITRKIGTKKRPTAVTAFATKTQATAYSRSESPKPKPPKPEKVEKAPRNITFCAPVVVRAASGWDKNAPAYYPVDSEGNPLYKITIAPPQPQPTKTNTHSGAY